MTNIPYSIKAVAEATAAARKRIGNRICNTPVIRSKLYGEDLYYKADNFQHTGSFKIRGAISKLTKLLESHEAEDLKLITASSGNHGIGASAAATELGLTMTVVLPTNVAKMKLARIKANGATALLEGEEAGASEDHAKDRAKRDGYVYVSPYNDPDIIAGQGTIGLELLEAFGDQKIDNVFISVGGGGLISGIGAAIKNTSPDTKIWGVSATNSAAFDAALKEGRVIETEHLPTLADAVAGGVDTHTITLGIAQQVVDESLLCSEEDIEDCFRKLALEEGMVVEGAAALALAGYGQVRDQVKGQTSVVLLCGSNIDSEQARRLIANQ